MASETLFTVVAYKSWPAAVPATNTPTSMSADATLTQNATTAWTADGELVIENYDDQSISFAGEAVSPFEDDYAVPGVIIETVWRARTGSGGGAANLAVSRTASTVTVVNSGGDDAVLPAASTSQAGVMAAADKTKLDGIAAGAQVNPTAAAIVAAIDAELGQTNWHSGSPFYDALALGVVADGVTDDTSNINTAISTVNAAGGGFIILPPKTMLTPGNVILLPNVHLIGQGADTEFLVPNTIGGSVSVIKTQVATPLTNASIRDFKITVTAGGTRESYIVTAVDANNVTGFNATGITVDNADVGFNLTTASYSKVSDNTFANMRGVCIHGSTALSYLSVARNRDDGATSLTVLSNLTNSVIYDNVGLNETDDGISVSGTSCVVHGNTITSAAAIGIAVAGTGNAAYSNSVASAGNDGINVSGTKHDVYSNTVSTSGGGLTNTYNGIHAFNCTYSRIRDNAVTAGGNEQYLLGESGSSDFNYLYDNVVSGTPATGEYGVIGPDSHLRRPDVESALQGLHAGAVVGKVGASVTSNGTVVTATLFGAGAGQDFQVVFIDEVRTFDGSLTTVNLTAGTNTAPQINYVYFLESTKNVAASTSGWPAANHIPFATVLVQSASDVQTSGPYGLTLVAQTLDGLGYTGGLIDIGQWLREQPPRWISGGVITPSIVTNAGSVDDIDLATTAATLLRRERITFPSRDTGGADSMFVYNHSTIPYNKVGSLGTVLQTNSGAGSIANGQYASIVVWGAASETTTIAKLFVNLPSGFYTLDTEAKCDAKRYASYSIPDELKNSAFLIARIVFQYTTANNGTWVHTATYDLRGRSIDSTKDGNPPFSREFLDTEFKIRDNTDPTKVARFELSGIGTGTERTFTAPNANGTLTLLEVAQSFSAGAKKTFSHDATNSGLNIAPVAGDPSSPADGDVWYNVTLNKFRKRENGVTTDLDTQGSASPLGNDNDFQYNNGGAFGGASGLVYNETDSRPYAANGIEVGEVSSPATPAANRALLYAKDIASLTRPSFITSLAIPFELASAQTGDRQSGYWWALPESAVVNNGHRLNFSNHGSGSLLAFSPVYAASGYTKYARVRGETTTASNITAGVRCGTKWMMSEYGYLVRMRFGLATPASGWSGFIGLTNSAAALSGGADPSSFASIVAVGWDTTDTTLQVMHNDSTGTATKIDLGAGFPADSQATDIYDVAFYAVPGATSIEYRVERVWGGSNQVATGTISTDMPANTLPLGFQAYASNRTSAAIVRLDLMGFYWETPF
ncbi:MAG: NosD domain-containing protein [Hyphomicrobiaceae bacterium]